MVNPRLLPTLLIIIDIGAAAVWATHGDWRKAIYWIAAAILTATVTY